MTGATRRACLGSGPLVGALRDRRAQRSALTAPSTPYESPGIRLPRSMAPSSGLRPPNTGPTSSAEEEPQAESQEESKAGRLLAARRRKA